jgi:molybdopterin synthase sulfur carrier subunit
MVRVYIPAALRELAAGEQFVDVDAATVRGIVIALNERFPGIGSRLVHDDAIVAGLAISIDGVFTPRGLLAEVEPHSEVHFLPAIGGG